MPIILLLYRDIESAHAAVVTDQQSLRAHEDNGSEVDGDSGDTCTELMLPSNPEAGKKWMVKWILRMRRMKEAMNVMQNPFITYRVMARIAMTLCDSMFSVLSCLDGHKLSPNCEEDSSTVAQQPSEDAKTVEPLADT